MPAAAVIPAPIAYAKVAAVKKLVVEPRAAGGGRGSGFQAAVLRAVAPLPPHPVRPYFVAGWQCL